MPRWTVNWDFFLLRAMSKTIVLPTRWTRSMRVPVSVSSIRWAGDLSGSGCLPRVTAMMRVPWTRAWTPLATVSTSGSSGMLWVV